MLILDSVIQKDRECYICGSCDRLESHHIYGGVANRSISEELGYKVWLCFEHHRGTNGVHGKNGKSAMEYLHRKGQEHFEQTGTREEFIKLFGKSYL